MWKSRNSIPKRYPERFIHSGNSEMRSQRHRFPPRRLPACERCDTNACYEISRQDQLHPSALEETFVCLLRVRQMRRRRIHRVVFLAIAAWPTTALADVGTPLVWANTFHLLLGNALLGLFEGWILSRVFALPLRRCVILLVLANYISAWTGVALVSFLFNKSIGTTNDDLCRRRRSIEASCSHPSIGAGQTVERVREYGAGFQVQSGCFPHGLLRRDGRSPGQVDRARSLPARALTSAATR